MTVSTIHDSTCRACGRVVEHQQVVSRHTTSEGVVSWMRCTCGALQARFRPYGRTERVVASGGGANRNGQREW
jgi:hypothetical protein